MGHKTDHLTKGVRPSLRDKHYRVVRFIDDFSLGPIREVLQENLSFDEAKSLAREKSGVEGEQIVVQDEREVGLESEKVY